MYTIVEIDTGGYVQMQTPTGGRVVHKETRDLHTRPDITCFTTLAAAKAAWDGPNSVKAILELNDEGGGCAMWMADEQREELTARLAKWRGCYGRWTVRRLNG